MEKVTQACLYTRLGAFVSEIFYGLLLSGRAGGYMVPGLRSYSEYNKEPVKSKKYRNGCVLNAVFYVFIYWRKKRRKSKAQLKTDPIHMREFRKLTRIKPNAIFVLYKRYYAILTLDELLESVGIEQSYKKKPSRTGGHGCR